MKWFLAAFICVSTKRFQRDAESFYFIPLRFSIIRAVDENDFQQRLYAFLRSVFKETLRVFNFLFCVLEPERSLKIILFSVYIRFYEAFIRVALRIAVQRIFSCLQEKKASVGEWINLKNQNPKSKSTMAAAVRLSVSAFTFHRGATMETTVLGFENKFHFSERSTIQSTTYQ